MNADELKAVIKLAEIGFAAASSYWQMREKHHADEAAERDSVRALISETSARLASDVKASIAQVIDKLESDNLEVLHARIDNVAIALRLDLNERGPLLQAALTLNESITYARNRASEGKL